jgi:hypothetical protein
MAMTCWDWLAISILVEWAGSPYPSCSLLEGTAAIRDLIATAEASPEGWARWVRTGNVTVMGTEDWDFWWGERYEGALLVESWCAPGHSPNDRMTLFATLDGETVSEVPVDEVLVGLDWLEER